MAKKRSISVNRMIGQMPLIASLTPVQLGSGTGAFFIGYLVYSNTNSLPAGVAAFLWVFFTSVLVLGKHHWQFFNKFRQPPRWSQGRRVFRSQKSFRSQKFEVRSQKLGVRR
jgi:hypothetical protein